MAEKIEFTISVTEDELSKTLGEAGVEAEKTRKKIAGISNVLSDAADELSRIKASFVGNLGANAVSAAFSGLKNILGSVVQDTRDFSRSIAEINSTIPATSKVTKDLSDQLIRLSVNYGTRATDQAAGFYEVVSGGIEDTATALNVLNKANDLALGGLTNVNTAARLISSTFLAYSQQGTSVAEITDTISSVAQQSAVRIEDLANTIGRVTPLAAVSNISIGELGGAIAFLNNQALTTEQSVTGLRGVIAAVLKPTQEATKLADSLGLSFNSAALQSKGLAGFLQEVVKATKGNSATLSTLFGDINAINAILAISKGGFDSFRQSVDKATESQGDAKKAADALRDSLDFQLKERDSAFQALSLTIGQALAPALTAAAKATTTFFKNFLPDAPRGSLEGLNKELQKTESIITAIEKRDFLVLQRQGIDASVLTNQKLNDVLQKQLGIRDELLRKITEAESAAAPAAAPAIGGGNDLSQAINDDFLQKRTDALQKLAIVEAEFEAQRQQRLFDAAILAGENQQLEFERLLQFEQAKVDARFAKELEATELIKNEELKRLAQKEISTKKELALESKKNSELSKLKQAEAQETQRILSIRNNYIQAAAQIGAALFKNGSKEAFIIQKLAALAGIKIDDAKARAASVAVAAALPPGVSQAYLAKQFALITSNTALATAGVVASSLSGFQNGGIVGATSGADNRLATIRDGEMILNADQQRSLFDAINSGSLGGGQIVVQIDGRTVATALRDQFRGGFRFA